MSQKDDPRPKPGPDRPGGSSASPNSSSPAPPAPPSPNKQVPDFDFDENFEMLNWELQQCVRKPRKSPSEFPTTSSPWASPNLKFYDEPPGPSSGLQVHHPFMTPAEGGVPAETGQPKVADKPQSSHPAKLLPEPATTLPQGLRQMPKVVKDELVQKIHKGQTTTTTITTPHGPQVPRIPEGARSPPIPENMFLAAPDSPMTADMLEYIHEITSQSSKAAHQPLSKEQTTQHASQGLETPEVGQPSPHAQVPRALEVGQPSPQSQELRTRELDQPLPHAQTLPTPEVGQPSPQSQELRTPELGQLSPHAQLPRTPQGARSPIPENVFLAEPNSPMTAEMLEYIHEIATQSPKAPQPLDPSRTSPTFSLDRNPSPHYSRSPSPAAGLMFGIPVEGVRHMPPMSPGSPNVGQQQQQQPTPPPTPPPPGEQKSSKQAIMTRVKTIATTVAGRIFSSESRASPGRQSQSSLSSPSTSPSRQGSPEFSLDRNPSPDYSRPPTPAAGLLADIVSPPSPGADQLWNFGAQNVEQPPSPLSISSTSPSPPPGRRRSRPSTDRNKPVKARRSLLTGVRKVFSRESRKSSGGKEGSPKFSLDRNPSPRRSRSPPPAAGLLADIMPPPSPGSDQDPSWNFGAPDVEQAPSPSGTISISSTSPPPTPPPPSASSSPSPPGRRQSRPSADRNKPVKARRSLLTRVHRVFSKESRQSSDGSPKFSLDRNPSPRRSRSPRPATDLLVGMSASSTRHVEASVKSKELFAILTQKLTSQGSNGSKLRLPSQKPPPRSQLPRTMPTQKPGAQPYIPMLDLSSSSSSSDEDNPGPQAGPSHIFTPPHDLHHQAQVPSTAERQKLHQDRVLTKMRSLSFTNAKLIEMHVGAHDIYEFLMEGEMKKGTIKTGRVPPKEHKEMLARPVLLMSIKFIFSGHPEHYDVNKENNTNSSISMHRHSRLARFFFGGVFERGLEDKKLCYLVYDRHGPSMRTLSLNEPIELHDLFRLFDNIALAIEYLNNLRLSFVHGHISESSIFSDGTTDHFMKSPKFILGNFRDSYLLTDNRFTSEFKRVSAETIAKPETAVTLNQTSNAYLKDASNFGLLLRKWATNARNGRLDEMIMLPSFKLIIAGLSNCRLSAGGARRYVREHHDDNVQWLNDRQIDPNLYDILPDVFEQ